MKSQIVELRTARDILFKKTKGTGTIILRSFRSSVAAAPPQLRVQAIRALVAAAGLFVLIGGYKYVTYKREQLKRAAEMEAGPLVHTTTIGKAQGDHDIVLIGETRPYQSATLYAKVSGYLRSVDVDKGTAVKRGQMLARIDSPETDQAYIAAEADARNKQAISSRMQALYRRQLVSQQEAEQAQADSDVATARLRSEQTLKEYEVLRAPFTGTITARFADPGALVQNAANSQTSALPVVTIADVRRLRVDVFLDQRDAPFVHKNAPVSITLPERPGVKIEGRVDRLSDELDPRTKMLMTEIDIPNDDRALVAGSFVRVSLQIKSPPYVQAPVEALTLKNNKTYLTVITPENTLTYKPVEIANNDGKQLAILSGVKEGDVVALNLGNTLSENSKVRPIKDDASAAAESGKSK